MDKIQERESKRKRVSSVDMLSNLPDEILCKILSYLPTKNAIATRVLSTKWKYISPFSVQPITLDVDDSLLLNPLSNKSRKELSASFVEFMNKLVHVVPNFEVMKLRCHKKYGRYGDGMISEWVFSGRCNLRELVLSVSLKRSDEFFSLLSGLKLTSLRLGKSFFVRVPSTFALPNLKVLILFKLMFTSKFEYLDDYTDANTEERNMFSDLIDGCPALEDLCLSKCRFIEHPGVFIKSDKLKKLTIKASCFSEHENYLSLEAPNLEELFYDDWFNVKISDFKSLLVAHLDVGLCDQRNDDDAYWYSEGIVTTCSSTVSLSLATGALFAMQRLEKELPIFHNLTCLALGCLLESEGWELLANLLCNAPNLERLTLKEGFGKHEKDGERERLTLKEVMKSCGSGENEEGYSSFVSVLPEPPICLQVHVKEIKFEVFNEEEDEIKLVKYFLKYGNVIQNLQLYCLPFKKTSTERRLLKLPKYAKIDFQAR